MQISRPLPVDFHGIALAWAEGHDLASIAQRSRMQEGDLVGALQKTLDLIGQLRGAASRARSATSLVPLLDEADDCCGGAWSRRAIAGPWPACRARGGRRGGLGRADRDRRRARTAGLGQATRDRAPAAAPPACHPPSGAAPKQAPTQPQGQAGRRRR